MRVYMRAPSIAHTQLAELVLAAVGSSLKKTVIKFPGLAPDDYQERLLFWH